MHKLASIQESLQFPFSRKDRNSRLNSLTQYKRDFTIYYRQYGNLISSQAASQTCVLTVLLITVVRAVIFPITMPGQTDTASWLAAELISCAHRGSWGSKKRNVKLARRIRRHTIPKLIVPLFCIHRNWMFPPVPSTHCSSSHLTGHHSRSHHHTSSQH